MHTLSIDIETYSSVKLADCGVYKYAEAADFDVLLIAYSIDGAPVEIIDITTQELPAQLTNMLISNTVIKTAYNAQFERVCLSAYLRKRNKRYGFLSPVSWECTMVRAAMAGYPFGLDKAAAAIGLPEAKDKRGKLLIKYFCEPCKPTKVNGGRTRNLPIDAPDKWQAFKEYCKQDVAVEQSILNRLSAYRFPEFEHTIWVLDQHINDTGIEADVTLAQQAVCISNAQSEKLLNEASELTGLDNPNSVAQLKTWLNEETGNEVTSLSKKELPALIANAGTEKVQRILKIRQQLSKSSVKKYNAILNAVCADNRIRGLYQYYGANRTGRFSGRLVQTQNLRRNDMQDLDLARELARDGDLALLQLMFGDTQDVLSQLIRTSFVAPIGKTLLVADFSAIEARVLAWLANETWRLRVFNTHGKIYEASAAAMFKIPIENVTKGSNARMKGKIAELALGYQGGVGALVAMGALDMGLTEDELPKLVQSWRAANPNIRQYWYDVEKAAKQAINGFETTLPHNISFKYKQGNLIITLPSGRKLYYPEATIADNKFGGTAIRFKGVEQTTGRWGWSETYSGKLVENITQAVARDCLTHAIVRLDNAGYGIVMHVHDEIVAEGQPCELDEMLTLMSEDIVWAKGLPLKADGYSTNFYKKD